MDGDRFDTLLRSLSDTPSRRGALRVIAALAFGGVAVSRVHTAGAKKKSCGPCRKRRKGKCKLKRPDGTPCGNGNVCRDGQCDPNACRTDCSGAQAVPCGPAGSSCQCVHLGQGVGACVRPPQGASCEHEECAAGEICGIACTGYMPFCWELCVQVDSR